MMKTENPVLKRKKLRELDCIEAKGNEKGEQVAQKCALRSAGGTFAHR